MSSDAAAYFPDALLSCTEMGNEAECVSEITASLLDSVESPGIAIQGLAVAVISISEFTDQQLLEQVRKEDEEALALLFRRHARAVRNVAYRILRNEAEADDLVQDVFLFIFRKAALFDATQGAARSWIYQVAYHRAFDRRRYLNSRHFYSSQNIEETTQCMADPADELAFHELSMEGILGKQLASRFNARLTLEQKETIRLFFFEGYALKEIAQLTGRSLVNVRQYYYRGLERLRKYVLPEKLRSK